MEKISKVYIPKSQLLKYEEQDYLKYISSVQQKITSITTIAIIKPDYEIEVRSIIAIYQALSDEAKQNVMNCISAKSYHVSNLIPSNLITGDLKLVPIDRNVQTTTGVLPSKCFKLSDVFQHYFKNIRMDTICLTLNADEDMENFYHLPRKFILNKVNDLVFEKKAAVINVGAKDRTKKKFGVVKDTKHNVIKTDFFILFKHYMKLYNDKGRRLTDMVAIIVRIGLEQKIVTDLVNFFKDKLMTEKVISKMNNEKFVKKD